MGDLDDDTYEMDEMDELDFDPSECSVVRPYGEYDGKCGYCKSPNGSCSYGMDAVNLKVADYQSLIDKGWRRSGTWIYQPNNNKACCTYYTIRLDVNKFKASKGQTKALKKWDRYITTGEYKHSTTKPEVNEEESGDPMEGWIKVPTAALPSSPLVFSKSSRTAPKPSTLLVSSSSSSSSTTKRDVSNYFVQKLEPINKDIIRTFEEKLLRVIKIASQSGRVPLQDALNTSDESKIDEFILRSLNVSANPVSSRKKKGDFSTNIALRIAGQKTFREKHPSLSAPEIAKILVELFSAPVENDQLPADRWRAAVSTVPPGFINFIDLQIGDVEIKAEQKLPKEKRKEKKLNKLKAEESSQVAAKKMKIDSVSPKHKFEVETVQSKFDKECFEVYRRYQMAIHKDKPEKLTEKSYTDFLITSPLVYEEPKEGVPPCGFGSFHQIYRLDGKVVAVGVVDILPSCLSGVYFYYDPDLQYLSPGIVSAMKEIAWVTENQKYSAGLHYYYMGFYIHTCQKMRYKGKYRPSDLLCPITHAWVPLNEEVVQKIEMRENPRLADGNIPTVNDVIKSKQKEVLRRTPILSGNELFFVEDLAERSRKVVEAKLSTYIDRVGDLATKMLCCLN